MRLLTGFVFVIIILCSIAPGRDCDAARKQSFPYIWWAPDSSWAVGGFGSLRPGLLQEIMSKKPDELEGLKAYEMQLEEPGVWLGFSVGLRKVGKVVFTKGARFVLTDKAGKRVESETIIFYPDLLQTSLYDSRRTSIVVTKNSVWCNPNNESPSGFVKFPAGSIQLKNISSFELIGAVADTTQRAMK